MSERDQFGNHEAYDAKSLEKVGEQQRETLKEQLEHLPNKENKERETSARREALEQAAPAEKQPQKTAASPERHRVRTRKEREASYEKTMDEVRSQLSPTSRAFSDFIHQPVVEKVSDAVGATIARPNAILAGSVVAFLFTIGIYLVAKFNGYPLSGTETIASFIFGWALGLVLDYFRLLMFGKSR